MTDEESRRVVECVSQWMRIYHKNKGKYPNDMDADHSALLRRLLSGEKPLPNPPPLRYSYPDYKLAEGEEVHVGEILEWTGWFNDTDKIDDERLKAYYLHLRDGGYHWSVDQHISWKWIEKNGPENDRGVPESGILEYADGSRYQFYQKMHEFKKLIFPEDGGKPGIETFEKKCYFLKRIPDEREERI